jgi:hypothetical protein
MHSKRDSLNPPSSRRNILLRVTVAWSLIFHEFVSRSEFLSNLIPGTNTGI